MNRNRFFKSFFIIIIMFFGFSQPVFGQTGTVVKIDPNYLNVDPGDTFTIDVVVENVVNLWAFDVSIDFDPDIIAFDHSEFGGFLDAGLIAPVTSEPGRISCGLTQMLSSEPKSGSGILCSLTFIAQDIDGESDLVFNSVELVEDESFLLIPSTNSNGFVQVGNPKTLIDVFIPLLIYSGGK